MRSRRSDGSGGRPTAWLRPFTAVVLALGIAGSVGGCSSSEEARSAVPACPLDHATGVLEPLGPPGSIGIAVDDSRHLIITWGDGHRSVDVNGTLAVVSPAGQVVARVGDRVRLLGGQIRPGEFLACGPVPASGGPSSGMRA